MPVAQVGSQNTRDSPTKNTPVNNVTGLSKKRKAGKLQPQAKKPKKQAAVLSSKGKKQDEDDKSGLAVINMNVEGLPEEGVCWFCHEGADPDAAFCLGDLEASGYLVQSSSGATSEFRYHETCSAYCSGDVRISFDGRIPMKDIVSEWRRGRKLQCCICGKYGAVLGCAEQKCRKTYHYTCARRALLQKKAYFHKSDRVITCPDHADIIPQGERETEKDFRGLWLEKQGGWKMEFMGRKMMGTNQQWHVNYGDHLVNKILPCSVVSQARQKRRTSNKRRGKQNQIREWSPGVETISKIEMLGSEIDESQGNGPDQDSAVDVKNGTLEKCRENGTTQKCRVDEQNPGEIQQQSQSIQPVTVLDNDFDSSLNYLTRTDIRSTDVRSKTSTPKKQAPQKKNSQIPVCSIQVDGTSKLNTTSDYQPVLPEKSQQQQQQSPVCSIKASGNNFNTYNKQGDAPPKKMSAVSPTCSVKVNGASEQQFTKYTKGALQEKICDALPQGNVCDASPQECSDQALNEQKELNLEKEQKDSSASPDGRKTPEYQSPVCSMKANGVSEQSEAGNKQDENISDEQISHPQHESDDTNIPITLAQTNSGDFDLVSAIQVNEEVEQALEHIIGNAIDQLNDKYKVFSSPSRDEGVESKENSPRAKRKRGDNQLMEWMASGGRSSSRRRGSLNHFLWGEAGVPHIDKNTIMESVSAHPYNIISPKIKQKSTPQEIAPFITTSISLLNNANIKQPIHSNNPPFQQYLLKSCGKQKMVNLADASGTNMEQRNKQIQKINEKRDQKQKDKQQQLKKGSSGKYKIKLKRKQTTESDQTCDLKVGLVCTSPEIRTPNLPSIHQSDVFYQSPYEDHATNRHEYQIQHHDYDLYNLNGFKDSSQYNSISRQVNTYGYTENYQDKSRYNMHTYRDQFTSQEYTDNNLQFDNQINMYEYRYANNQQNNINNMHGLNFAVNDEHVDDFNRKKNSYHNLQHSYYNPDDDQVFNQNFELSPYKEKFLCNGAVDYNNMHSYHCNGSRMHEYKDMNEYQEISPHKESYRFNDSNRDQTHTHEYGLLHRESSHYNADDEYVDSHTNIQLENHCYNNPQNQNFKQYDMQQYDIQQQNKNQPVSLLSYPSQEIISLGSGISKNKVGYVPFQNVRLFRANVSLLPRLQDGEMRVLGQTLDPDVSDMYQQCVDNFDYLNTPIVHITTEVSRNVDGLDLSDLESQVSSMIGVYELDGVGTKMKLEPTLRVTKLLTESQKMLDPRQHVRGQSIVLAGEQIPKGTVLGTYTCYLGLKQDLQEHLTNCGDDYKKKIVGYSPYIPEFENMDLGCTAWCYGGIFSEMKDPNISIIKNGSICNMYNENWWRTVNENFQDTNWVGAPNVAILCFNIQGWPVPFVVSIGNIQQGEELRYVYGIKYWKRVQAGNI